MSARIRILVGLCSALIPLSSVTADDRFLLEGIFDLEAYATDDSSRWLSRNDGDPATVGRLQLWSAFQVTSSLQAYAMLEAESDNSDGRRENEAEIELAGLRWTYSGRVHTVVDAGKLLTPFGSLLGRNLSTRNPLIGEPTSVYAGYPLGLKISGTSGRFDYYAAVVDAPATDESYFPGEPDSAWRPDVGIGFSPTAGFRLGLLFTQGPYLGSYAAPALEASRGWRDYEQRLYGIDLSFARGYFELTGILFRSEFDIPQRPGAWTGTSYVIEMKYTWAPRFYTAVRLEQNDYPFIRAVSDDRWITGSPVVHDLEVGGAYRFSPGLQLKFAYRTDRWDVGRASGFPDGWSFGAQLSWKFDLGSLLSDAYP